MVTFIGENLGSVTNLIFNGNSGLQGVFTPKTPSKIAVESSEGGIGAIQPGNDKRVSASITVLSGASLRPCEVRVAGPGGVSNPLSLHLSPLPEIAEIEPNNSLKQAQRIDLPLVVNGRIKAATEIDYYRFHARKGQHLIFDVYAFRMGSPLDSSLVLLDAGGHELARNEDYHGLDSFLDFQAPQEGDYILQLRDYRYQGGADYKYRLLAGELPYVTEAFPLGGRRGQDMALDLQGHNLNIRSLTLHLETDAPPGTQEIRLDSPLGASNPILFDVGDAPEFNETEPNNLTNQANLVQAPVSINGRLNNEKDVDVFKFKADKDQRLVLEVKARRFGSPLDALLTLTDAQGKVLQQNDDAMGADARIDYDQFKKDREYYVSLRDLLGRGGPSFVYRLTIRQPEPDFSVKFLPDTPRIRRGGRAIIRCELTALNGFNETVRVGFTELPAGIFAEPVLLSPSIPASGLMILSASMEAPLGSFPIKTSATASVDGKTITHAGEPISNDRSVKQAFLTVLAPAPFTLEASPLNIVLEQDQAATADILVQRQAGFLGDIKLTAEGFSAGRDPATRSLEIPVVILKAGELLAKVKLKARLDSEVGTRTMVFRGETSVSGLPLVEYSQAVPVTLAQFPFVLNPTLRRLSVTALPATVQSAAREAVCEVKVERRMGFKKEIQLTLEGVPEGITGSIESIPENGNEAVLKLVASEKAPVGKQFTLQVSGAGLFNDRTSRQKAAPITLMVVASEQANQTVAAGSSRELSK